VDRYVGIARVDAREVDPGTHLATPALGVDEMQDVTLVLDAALEVARDEITVDALEDLGHARAR